MLGIDCNEDARSGAIAKMLRCLGMKDAILGLHSKSDPPETCNKNHNRRPIDGIFVTSGIKPTAGGYSSYGQMMDSDHRTLWIDIPFTSFLGHNPPNRPNRQPRRLRGKDPRTTEKYNHITKKEFAKAKNAIPDKLLRLKKLHAEGANMFDIMALHSEILKPSIILRFEAAHRTRHLFTGTFEWSPEWRKLDRNKKLWNVAHQRFDRRIRGRTIDKLMRKAGNTDCYQCNKVQSRARFLEATQALEDFKPSAAFYREAHLHSLAKSISLRDNTSEDLEYKKLTNQERQKKTGARLRAISKNGNKGLVTKFLIKNLETG